MGDSPCPSGKPDSPPSIEFDTIRSDKTRSGVALGVFPLGVPFVICFSGFDASKAIGAVVTLPDGTQRTEFTNTRPADPPREKSFRVFLAFPPDPLGQYQVQATQGSLSATGTFTIRAPTRPNVEPLLDEVGRGDSLPVALSGFDPREKVALRLYRKTASRRVTDIYTRGPRVASLRVDARGFARTSVVVGRRGLFLLAVGSLSNRFPFAVSGPA